MIKKNFLYYSLIPIFFTLLYFINKKKRIMKNIYDKYSEHFKYINPRVKEVFAKFLNELINNGYTVTITSSFRTLEKQRELHNINKNNPLYSYHNFGLAIDIVLAKIENNKTIILTKNNKADWINRGIDKIASKYNLVWGGNFPNYIDCVHFDARNYINKMPSELYLIAQNKSIENTPYLV